MYKPSSLNRYSDFIFFTSEAPSKIRVISGGCEHGLVPIALLTIEEREKLVQVEQLPGKNSYKVVDFGSLWLGEGGSPLSTSAWNWIFSAASDRLRKSSDLAVHITPHVLRHTYAVYTLNNMISGVLGIRTRRRYLDRRSEIYERLIGDPLYTLQRLLGHRDIKTTYKYLNYVDENKELLKFAIMEWDRLNGLSGAEGPNGLSAS